MSEIAEKLDEARLVREADRLNGCKSYAVLVDGQRIGRIYQEFPTFERRSAGRRYVNSRWTSKRSRWKTEYGDGRYQRGFVETRKEAVAEVLAAFRLAAGLARGGDA